MQVSDVMSTQVISVTPEQTVQEVAKVFVDNKISGAPVLDDGAQIVGIISEGDLIRRVELGTEMPRKYSWLNIFAANEDALDYIKTHARKVKDVMSTNVTSVSEATSLTELANVFASKHIKRVPVMRAGNLVGIVSRSNLVQALASISPPEPLLSNPTDREIRAMLLGEMAGREWEFPGKNIVVTDGVVHLWGLYGSTLAVNAVRVAAESIPGVKRVEDHTGPFPAIPAL